MHLMLIIIALIWCETVHAKSVSASETTSSVKLSDDDCLGFGIASERCGDELCCCVKKFGVAVCSGLISDPVHYVPEFPFRLQVLFFLVNNLTSIREQNFFENATSTSALDLRANNLTRIHPAAFSLLKNLSALYLNYNPEISPTALSTVLATSSLKHLDLGSCDLGRVSSEVFQHAALPRLSYLGLADNRIEQLNLSVFATLTTLKHVDLSRNRLLHAHVDSAVPFEHLDLSFNFLMNFPRTCDRNHASLVPNLRTLVLEKNLIASLPTKTCLPQLRILDLSGNKLVYPRAFDGQTFPFLTRLDLSNNDGIISLETGLFNNLTQLKVVDFGSSNVLITARSIQQSFVNCPLVSELYFRENFFDNEPATHDFCGLKTLDLGSCSISTISARTFCSFPQLQNLGLSKNSLDHLPDGAFDCLPSLIHLDLSFNRILAVSPDTFNVHLRQQLVYLDLGYNMFQCNCDLLWLRGWMERSPSIFYVDSRVGYSCRNIPSTTVQTFVLNDQACLLSHTTNVTMVSMLSLLIIIVTVVVAVCRYHWHLRLLCYEACRGPSHVRRQRLQEGRFDYDVFVSYDSEDLAWVRQHLVPELEGRLGLRLCLHERDFPAGYILDNIVRSVESSKKILMLFSRHFVESRWCQFELSFCLCHAMEYEDDLIVVCLDDVTSHELTSGMMAVLKTTTYLQWVDGSIEDTAYFWRRLAVGLQEIMTGPPVV